LLNWVRRLGAGSCPRCGFESLNGFCGDCRREFPRIEAPCLRCGLPPPCDPCPALAGDWHVDAVRAPFVYGPPIARYLRNLKYARERHLGRALGQLLAAGIELGCIGSAAPDDSAAPDVDALVAVPLHRRRLRARTFNQADEIGAAVARLRGIPLLSAGVRRAIDTQPQTELDRAERLRGPRRAFRVGRRFEALRLAIVDDVITTGATANALASVLKSAGATRVEAWAVARSVGAQRVT
jgi:ComF family protein